MTTETSGIDEPAEPSPTPAGPAQPIEAPPASLAGAVSFTVGLFLIALQFPLALILAPLPLLRLGLRKGPAIQAAGAAFALVATGAVLLAFESDASSLALVLAIFAASVVLPVRLALRGVSDGWGIGRTTISIVAAESAWCLAVGAYLTFEKGFSVGGEILGMFDEVRLQSIERLSEAGVSSTWIADFDKSLKMSGEFWSTRYLVLLVIACAIGLAFVLSMVPRLSGRPEDPALQAFRFEEFRNPFVLVFGFILGGVGSVMGGGPARFLASNLLGAVLFLCFLQGFSVVYAFLARIPVGRWFRCLVYLLIIQFPVSLAVAGIGLLDEFFEFRRFRP